MFRKLSPRRSQNDSTTRRASGCSPCTAFGALRARSCLVDGGVRRPGGVRPGPERLQDRRGGGEPYGAIPLPGCSWWGAARPWRHGRPPAPGDTLQRQMKAVPPAPGQNAPALGVSRPADGLRSERCRRSGAGVSDAIGDALGRRVSQGGRRGLAVEPPGGEDAPDPPGILDRREPPHPTPAAGTGEPVEGEDPSQQVSAHRDRGGRGAEGAAAPGAPRAAVGGTGDTSRVSTTGAGSMRGRHRACGAARRGRGSGGCGSAGSARASGALQRSDDGSYRVPELVAHFLPAEMFLDPRPRSIEAIP